MKKILLVLALLHVSFVAAYAQEATPNQQTAAPADCRFEIIQSTIAAKATFKLDKMLGIVYQLVLKKSGDLTWQPIPIEPHPLDTVKSGKVNYQIFTSGIALKFTLLLNVNTGATWQLAEDSEKDMIWQALR